MVDHNAASSSAADSAESILAQLDQHFSSDDDFWIQEGENLQASLAGNADSLYSMVTTDSNMMDLGWDDMAMQQSQLGSDSTRRPALRLDLQQLPTQRQQATQLHATPEGLRHAPPSDAESSNENSSASLCSRACGQACLGSLFQLALELHVPNEACTAAAASSPTQRVEQASDDFRGIDAVLFQNRCAVRLLSQVLECPCARELSVTLAAYLVASKIVAWYGAILGVECTASMASRITARPILMGSYSLEADAQRSVRAKVVLSELNMRVEPLLANLPYFHQSCSGGHSSSSSSSSSSSPQPASPLDQRRCFLRDQLQKVVREAGRGMGRC